MTTTIFCTLAFSPGIPMMNVLAAAYMFVAFWSDKVVLLRGSCRTPEYDSRMPRQACRLATCAGALHCFMGICMFGQPCTSPKEQPVTGGGSGPFAWLGTTSGGTGLMLAVLVVQLCSLVAGT